jgi:hypothetical protein
MLTSLFFYSNSFAQNVDEIIEKNNKARSVEVFKTIKAIESKLTTTGGGQSVSEKHYYIKPDKIRIEASSLENKRTIVFNQEKGYVTDGKVVKHFQKVSKEEQEKGFKSLTDNINSFEPQFMNYKEREEKVTFSGKETLDEGECDILKITDKEGKESFIYILENGLEVKLKFEAKGKEMEILLKDNKKVAGALIPHLIVYMEDGEEVSKKKFDYIIFNGKIKEELFNILEETK